MQINSYWDLFTLLSPISLKMKILMGNFRVRSYLMRSPKQAYGMFPYSKSECCASPSSVVDVKEIKRAGKLFPPNLKFELKSIGPSVFLHFHFKAGKSYSKLVIDLKSLKSDIRHKYILNYLKISNYCACLLIIKRKQNRHG